MSLRAWKRLSLVAQIVVAMLTGFALGAELGWFEMPSDVRRELGGE